MTTFRLIAAAAISLALATPAMAMHRGYHHHRYFSSRAFSAYAFHRGYDFAPRSFDNDFDRRNTFN